MVAPQGATELTGTGATRSGRVVLVVGDFPKLSETFIVNKFLMLLNAGWDVHVVCDRSQPLEILPASMAIGLREVKTRVHCTWAHGSRSGRMIRWVVALANCMLVNPSGTARYFVLGFGRYKFGILKRFLSDARFIVLRPAIIHFEFGTSAIGRSTLKEALSCKVVVSFRGYDLAHVGLERPDHYREVWDLADTLHFLSNPFWEKALLRGCPPTKPHVRIPPAIDVRLFDHGGRTHTAMAGTKERPIRILSVGRLEWVKGYDYALVAVRILLDQGLVCSYSIVGDGRYLDAVAFARRQLNLEDVVKILGSLRPDEIRAQMSDADVFLHAAVSEGFSNAVLEAQAMGLPVVCTDAGGLPENVVDGVTGFVVPRRDARAMAEKVRVLAEDPMLREQFACAGKARVLEEFQLSRQLHAFESLYYEVAKASN